MKIDPRIDGDLKTAPVWAKALLAMTAHLLGPDKTKASIDAIGADKAPDYNTVVQGRRLISWLGVPRAAMEKHGVTEAGVLEIQNALAERGRDVAYLDKVKPVAPTPGTPIPSPTVASGNKEQPAGGSETAKNPEGNATGTTGTTGKPAPEPKKIAGHLVKDLAGKPVAELVKIEGISAAKAKELAALKPGTEE